MFLNGFKQLHKHSNSKIFWAEHRCDLRFPNVSKAVYSLTPYFIRTAGNRTRSIRTFTPTPILTFGTLGIEPSLYEPESYVLPVYYVPMNWCGGVSYVLQPV